MQPLRAPAFRATGAASVLAEVRHATRATHEALDTLLPSGLRSLHDYRRYLAALLALAEWLAGGRHAAWPAHAAIWDDPQRLACLRADCAALAITTEPAAQPLSPDWAHWLGGCYVIEGSALGARLLAGHVAELAEGQGEVRHARRFLAHVTGDPSRWRRFARLLEAMPAAHAAATTAGARDGFAIVHARLALQGAPA